MTSLQEIRKRIKGAKNTEKITKAMQMVAASKLRRAQENMENSREFHVKLNKVVSMMILQFRKNSSTVIKLLSDVKHKKKGEILILTSNRGLCGGFNNNVIRSCIHYITKQEYKLDSVTCSTIGKKGFMALKYKNFNIRKNYEFNIKQPTFQYALNIANELCDYFLKNKLDIIWLAYNKFKNISYQEVVIEQLLPIIPMNNITYNENNYIYEPNNINILKYLLSKYFAMNIFQALLESFASEHGARMTAMDNAVRNAKEIISKLTLTYNRARQSAITRELIEIISGAEVL